MAEDDVSTSQDTPVTDSAGDTGHSDAGDVTPPDDSGVTSDTQGDGLPGEDDKDTPSGDDDAGHGDQTPKPERYDEEAYKKVQGDFTRERQARLDLEKRLATLEGAKPKEAEPSEIEQKEARIQGLKQWIAENHEDDRVQAAWEEIAELRGEIGAIKTHERTSKTERQATAVYQAHQVVKQRMPELYNEDGTPDTVGQQETWNRYVGHASRLGFRDNPHAPLIAHLIDMGLQVEQERKKAQLDGAAQERARKQEVKARGPAGGAKKGGSAADYGLTAQQKTLAKNMGISYKGYAESLGLIESGTED